jgi:hypothetical protein
VVAKESNVEQVVASPRLDVPEVDEAEVTKIIHVLEADLVDASSRQATSKYRSHQIMIGE